ncbi:peptidoglycan binding domain-containing protein [Microbacterium sp. NIBRBAC000506063]|uniref:peptidoglycan binding domain-containing protein n=1 Tax=Microbacterium sp. NIBRBAC000506063 TaxID=2734618 RepID=UPI001BB4EE7B|nr:peptidoglycan binding domain-containing protein [Microbacterium sp. NIBRBAC000506063]QTV79337.1 peptidoglycan binding domain-containing protein [Microbacterium sp. NIBRBAC000506063]
MGGLTPGAAAEKVSSTIAGTEITLTGTGTAATVTGADLGVSVDAQLLAQEAHAAHPFWDFGSWNPEPSPVALTLDPETAESKLRSAVPAAWEAPVDATVVFDADENTFVMTPATSGTGIDIDALTAAIGDALAAGETEVTFSEGPIAYAPDITDEAATEALETANAMIRKSGFYVGKERVVSLKRATVAGWFDFVAEDGALRLEPDLAAIQATVDIVPDKANAEPVTGKEIVNSSGTVLRAVEEGKAGREVIGVENIAEGVAEQIRLGSATYQLEVKEVPSPARRSSASSPSTSARSACR